MAGREEPDHEGLRKSRSNEGFQWTSDMVTGREGQVGGRAAAQVKGQSVIGALPGSCLAADNQCEASGLGQPLSSAAVCWLRSCLPLTPALRQSVQKGRTI